MCRSVASDITRPGAATVPKSCYQSGSSRKTCDEAPEILETGFYVESPAEAMAEAVRIPRYVHEFVLMLRTSL